MEIVIKVLQLILSLSLLVFLHELGHYLTARMFGIRVEKFYLFFDAWGFSLLKFKIGDTTFGMGWVPFGGYCKIAGMIDESMDTEAMKKPAQPWEFRSKPAWQRLIVMVGGVVMNIIAACFIYIGMSWHWGEKYVDNSDLVCGYSYNALAEEIGFRDGDRIVSFDGEPVTGDFSKLYSKMVMGGVKTVGVVDSETDQPREVVIPEDKIADMLSSTDFMAPRVPFVVAEVPAQTRTELLAGDSLVSLGNEPMMFLDDYQRSLAAVADSTVWLLVARDSAGMTLTKRVDVHVSPEGQLGVKIKGLAEFYPVQTVRYGFWQGIPAGFRKAGQQIGNYFEQLKLIFSPQTKAYKQVGSLIAIGSIFPGTWDWFSFWSITAFLSIALAVLNILPIPALDGGHVLFLLWEVVTRRKPSDKFLERAQMVGLILLLLLIVLTFGNDIYRFFIK